MKLLFPARLMKLQTNVKLLTVKENPKLFTLFHQGRAQFKKRGSVAREKLKEEKLKILRPGDCKEDIPLLHPKCKTAIVVAGGRDVGFSAADSLLCHGAKNVVLIETAVSVGQQVVKRLCEKYGRERAQLGLCGLNSASKFEALFTSIQCKHKNIHILFNNLDGDVPQTNDDDGDDWSKTRRAIEVGVKYMGKQNGGEGGIIINAGRILGFMGWPEEPVPVYYSKEPLIETTQDLARIYPFDKTGVRIITLLNAPRNFEEIGLPDFPASDAKSRSFGFASPSCPSAMHEYFLRNSKIGRAITHVMAKGQNGSTWLIETPVSLRETPRLIHFPKKGEKIDPKIYNEVVCPATIETSCASTLSSKIQTVKKS